MNVHSYRTRALLVAPIRLLLGLLEAGAAVLAGASGRSSVLAFGVGALGITFVIFNDPRARFLQRDVEPLPLPAGARVAPGWRQALGATFPSTLGVSVFAVVALFAKPTLAALLGGVCAGLGLAALISLTRIDPSLYVHPKSSVIYRR